MIANPVANPELFPDHKYAVLAEESFRRRQSKPIPASDYAEWKDSLEWDIIDRNLFNLKGILKSSLTWS